MWKCEIIIENTVKNETSAYWYFGVKLDNLTSQEHITNVCRKCSTRVKLLFRLDKIWGHSLVGWQVRINSSKALRILPNLVTSSYIWTVLKQYENIVLFMMFLNHLTVLRYNQVKLCLRELCTKNVLVEMVTCKTPKSPYSNWKEVICLSRGTDVQWPRQISSGRLFSFKIYGENK